MSASESKNKGPLAGLFALLVAVLGGLGYWQLDGLSPKGGAPSSPESSAAAGAASGATLDSGAGSPKAPLPGTATPPRPSASGQSGAEAGTAPEPTRPPGQSGAGAPSATPSPPAADPDRPEQLVVVGPRGATDVAKTLRRIERGESHEHRNDGSTFQNREGRLPKRGRDHYREYVHPTPGVRGPGAQRIVIGKDGEVYYTPDHYESFQKLRWRLEMGNGK